MKGKVDLSQYDNSDYKPGGNSVKRVLWHLVNGLFFNSMFHFYAFKTFMLRLFGAKVGVGVIIKPHVNIKYPWNLSIGDHAWIGENVWIDSLDQVNIGSHACISQDALLLCGNHNYKIKTFDLMTGPITLEDGAWIGARSIVCGNVTCKSHSILMVGSVAAKDLEAYKIYRGNPAEIIKDRNIE